MVSKASLFLSVLIATLGFTALLYGVIMSASLTAAYDTLNGVGSTAFSSNTVYVATIPYMMDSYAIAVIGLVITVIGLYATFVIMSD